MDYRYKLDYPAIARRIKAARKQTGLTQAELAERIDISTNAVAKLENDLMAPSLQTLVNIANVLHMDLNDLFFDCVPQNDETAQDRLLVALLDELSIRDKAFLIHVISGLKQYLYDEQTKKP